MNFVSNAVSFLLFIGALALSANTSLYGSSQKRFVEGPVEFTNLMEQVVHYASGSTHIEYECTFTGQTNVEPMPAVLRDVPLAFQNDFGSRHSGRRSMPTLTLYNFYMSSSKEMLEIQLTNDSRWSTEEPPQVKTTFPLEAAKRSLVDNTLIDNTENTISARTILIVYTRTADSQPTFLPDEARSIVFGDENTPVSVASQYENCSYSKMRFFPAEYSEHVERGLIEIDLPDLTTEGNSVAIIRNAALAKLRNILGIESDTVLAETFDHVMVIVPSGTTNQITATASTHGWLSTFYDRWFLDLAALMHELGHNLGMSHSMDKGYVRDYQGYMSNTSVEPRSEEPLKCFNASKTSIIQQNEKLAWYKDAEFFLTDAEFLDGYNFQAKVIGLVDYGKRNQHPLANELFVTVTVESLVTKKAIHITYNKATEFNRGTELGRDKVTVVESTSRTSSVSSFLTELSPGDIYTYDDFFGPDDDLRIIANTLPSSTSSDHEYAMQFAQVALERSVIKFLPDGATPSDNPLNVQMITADPQATIYFTVDGSDPSLSSPWVVSGGMVNIYQSSLLRAIAVTDSYSSSVYTADFEITDLNTNRLPDAWENIYFPNASSVSSLEDSDRDGFSNMDEFLSGTSPTDANSFFKASVQNLPEENMLRISWQGTLGRFYFVEVSEDLRNWDLLSPRIQPENENCTFEIDLTDQGSNTRFYRISVE